MYVLDGTLLLPEITGTSVLLNGQNLEHQQISIAREFVIIHAMLQVMVWKIVWTNWVYVKLCLSEVRILSFYFTSQNPSNVSDNILVNDKSFAATKYTCFNAFVSCGHCFIRACTTCDHFYCNQNTIFKVKRVFQDEYDCPCPSSSNNFHT